jgi:hypothetical protein
MDEIILSFIFHKFQNAPLPAFSRAGERAQRIYFYCCWFIEKQIKKPRSVKLMSVGLKQMFIKQKALTFVFWRLPFFPTIGGQITIIIICLKICCP